MINYSKDQLKAINTINKHTAVIAGAGTGKTTVLIARIKKILDLGVSPKEILAITFTKKAAKEMKERLNNKDCLIMTFDAFCYHIVNQEFKFLESTGSFSKKELLDYNLYDANNKKGIKPRNYELYITYKNNNNLIDFNDLEYMALKIIKKESLSFKYILIDEFQDTNNLQYNIFTNLINKDTNTFIVGDPDQSIYKFRGANIDLIKKYITDFNALTIVLKDNYRSNKTIIKIANKLINKNKDRIKKSLVSYSNNVGFVKVHLFNDDIIEYNKIILLANDYILKNKSVGILFRNNEQGYDYKRYYHNTYSNITILTLHESKGLEFDVVFIIGINKEIIPSNIIKSLANIEEERRLFFVGITRAKEKLYLSANKKKSIFLKEIMK